jgi:hypothetical protein
MKRGKKPTGPTDAELIAGLFKPEEIKSIHDFESFEGKWVVLTPSAVSEPHRTRRGLLLKAEGGNGCRPKNMGTGVFGKSFEEGEHARWERYDIYGVFVGELPNEMQSYTVRIKRVTTQYKDVVVEALTKQDATLAALERIGTSPLGFSQPDTTSVIESVQPCDPE